MFCPNCGTRVNDGVAFCPNCGSRIAQPAPQPTFIDATKPVQERFETQFNSALNDMRGPHPINYGLQALKTDRSLLTYILLTWVTCGIYSLFFYYHLIEDVNTACDGDSEETTGLGMFILLSFLTCGIYPLYWMYKIGNRLQINATRYGMTFTENGTSILLWSILGTALCGIGPFIAMNILIKNTNSICEAYNRYNGLY